MILQTGDKILVVHRRLFETDKTRYFIGEVDGYEAGIMKATGHSWVQEQFAGRMTKKEDPRTKIFSLMSGTLLTYELPDEVDLKTLKLQCLSDGRLVLIDGSKFQMDLTEQVYRKIVGKKRS
jgi:hypothetical protein